MPNGRSIVLERQQGADSAGYSGLEDEVDNHWGALFKAALLSTLLGVGTELGSNSTSSGNNSDIIQALRRGSSGSANQTGQQIVRRSRRSAASVGGAQTGHRRAVSYPSLVADTNHSEAARK